MWERRQLAHGREAPAEEVAPPGEQHQGDGGPHEHDLARRGSLQGARQAAPGGGDGADPFLVLGLAELSPSVGAEDAAADLQAPHLGVGQSPPPLHRAAGGPELAQPADVPRPRRERRLPLRPPTRHQAAGELGDGVEGGQRQHPHEVKGPVVLQQGPQPVAGREHGLVAPVGSPPALGLEVTDAGGGRHHHAGSERLRPPAEVDVASVVGHDDVEAAQRREQVAADERARSGHREHVTHTVVLLLVELAPFDQRVGDPDTVHGQPDVGQPLGPLPLDQLRAHDAGIGAHGLFDEESHGVGVGSGVVVAEQEERRPLHRHQGLVGSLREPDRLQPAHVGVGYDRPHPRLQVAARPGVDDQHREVRIVLGAQSGEGLLQPVARVTGDDDGHHRRGRGEGLHLRAEGSGGHSGRGVPSICLQMLIKCGILVSDRPRSGGDPDG